ncbi:hypothetical protein HYR69_12055, partial [Candidatus Sumerlaeota bacterium]|nr:hypothetical protein [Candidatus Sumerlaeota bacterium]
MKERVKGPGRVMACLLAWAAFPFVAQAQFIGTNDDVPTWRITSSSMADSWSFTREINLTLNLNFSLLGQAVALTLPVNISDTFTKRLQSILTVNTGMAGFLNTRAYQRDRTGGLLTLTGSGGPSNTFTISGIPIRVTRVAFVNFTNENSVILPTSLTIPNPGLQTTAFDWVGVGDLSQIREAFGLEAAGGGLDFDVRCSGLVCVGILGCATGCCATIANAMGFVCGTNPATLWLGLMMDHGPTGPNPTRASAPFIDNSSGTRAVGNGSMIGLASAPNATGETWTLLCLADGGAGAAWSVTGSVSGAQAAGALTGTPYTSDNGMVSFTITAGSVDWDGPDAPAQDRIRFYVTRNNLTPFDASGSGLELIDFPTIPSGAAGMGENFFTAGARKLGGSFMLDAPGAIFDLTTPLSAEIITQYNILLNSGAQAAAGTPRNLSGSIAGFTDQINYLPTNRELSLWRLGSLDLSSTFDLRVTLTTLVTTCTAMIHLADA